jgi:hypothetical protein
MGGSCPDDRWSSTTSVLCIERLSLENDRYRPVVDERNVHHRSEGAGLHGGYASLAELPAEVVEEHLGFLRGSSLYEARALAFSGVSQQGELRDGEDLASGIPDVQIHFPFVVSEDAQARDLLGEPVGLGFTVSPGYADEEQEAGTYAGDLLAAHGDGGVLYALEDYLQGV